MAPSAPDDPARPPEWFVTAIGTPAKQAAIDVDGASIAYRTYGDREDRGIVLVHGGAAHARWWDHIAPLLAADHLVVALDLPGTATAGGARTTAWTCGRRRCSRSRPTRGSARRPP